MALPSFEAMAAGYRNMWASMRITRSAACEQAARRILAGRARYLAVERVTGVPWYWQGCAHMRESSCNFAGVLHNGEHIIGTGRKTRLVPAGRGPFKSWEEAAIDALKLKSLHKIKDWSIARMGYEFERFNGFGYIPRRVNSPYVWAGSNHYTRGKYVRDGVFSATHVDTQLGTMPILSALCKISPEVNERVKGKAVTSAPETTVATGGGGAVVAVGTQQGWGVLEWTIAAVLAIAVISVLVWAIRKWRRKEPTDLPAILYDETTVSERAGAAGDNEKESET